MRRTTPWLCALLLCSGVAIGDDSEPIGPTPIPFYTGNLSVSPFMAYWKTGKLGDDSVTPARIALIKRIACVADCDYQAWCLAEPRPDSWDFSRYRANALALHAAGLKYVAFCWVHFPPRWFIDSTDYRPYRCAEHGKATNQLSLWAPQTLDRLRAFYRAQHAAMGNLIDWMRVGMPSEYGEVGYPNGMTNWLVKQDHAHPGYWCGDAYARADFQAEMQRQYGDLAALNRRWGTSFAAWTAVDYPALAGEEGARRARQSGSAADRRRWLDFIAWYNGAWLRFVPKLVAIIREIYPETPLVVSVGYGSERLVWGNDNSALPKVAREHRFALQTPGNVPNFVLKRVSTPCHFYCAPYYTEPPGDVPPNLEVRRLFYDIANGVQVYFDYWQNLDRARPLVRAIKQHMTGQAPLVDLAVMCPMVQHRLNAGAHNFPEQAYLLGELGRDRFDFDTIDEQLIAEGALAHYRVLAWNQGGVSEAEALRAVGRWVSDGGTLVTGDIEVESVEGDRSLWRQLMPSTTPLQSVQPGGRWDWDRVAANCVKRIGKGAVIRVPLPEQDVAGMTEVVERAAHHLSRLAPGLRDGVLVDGAADRIVAVRLPDRVLYYNDTDETIVKNVTFRPVDWEKSFWHPEPWRQELKISPHSIRAIVGTRPARLPTEAPHGSTRARS